MAKTQTMNALFRHMFRSTQGCAVSLFSFCNPFNGRNSQADTNNRIAMTPTIRNVARQPGGKKCLHYYT